MGDFERAKEVFNKAIEKNPKDGSLWFEFAQCYARRKDLVESERCLLHAIELDPQNRDYQKKLGFTLAWNGKVDQGLVYLTRSRAALANLEIGCMFDQKDRPDLAVRHLRAARGEDGELLEKARILLAAYENPAAVAGPSGALWPRRN